MANIVIKDNILKKIGKIAKDHGKDEETFINDILTETIEEYGGCELLKKVKQAEADFEAGNSIKMSVEELAEELEVDLS